MNSNLILLLKKITSSFKATERKRLNNFFDSFLYKNSAPKKNFRRKKRMFQGVAEPLVIDCLNIFLSLFTLFFPVETSAGKAGPQQERKAQAVKQKGGQLVPACDDLAEDLAKKGSRKGQDQKGPLAPEASACF